MDTININGAKVQISSIKADVKAAKKKGLTGNFAFCPETVEGLIEKLEECQKKNLILEDKLKPVPIQIEVKRQGDGLFSINNLTKTNLKYLDRACWAHYDDTITDASDKLLKDNLRSANLNSHDAAVFYKSFVDRTCGIYHEIIWGRD